MSECKAWINEINWDMVHEDAVTLHLEWGNNSFKDTLRRPVTRSNEYSIYFVVDTWGPEPKVVLMKMNNYGSQALCEKALPKDMAEAYLKQIGGIKGIHEITPEIKDWLHAEFEKETGK